MVAISLICKSFQTDSLDLFPQLELELWAFNLLILSSISSMLASNCSSSSDIFTAKNSLQVGMFSVSLTSLL